jgi:hypothetical protein
MSSSEIIQKSNFGEKVISIPYAGKVRSGFSALQFHSKNNSQAGGNMAGYDEQHRSACAALIEKRIKQYVEERQFPPCTCTWNLSQGWTNAGPHRLDVCIKDGTFKVYFTDNELVSYCEDHDCAATDMRLHQLVDELGEDDMESPTAYTVKRLAHGIRP